MKYLVAEPGPKLTGAPPEYTQADPGEPVVPWFPAPPVNAFLGTNSWRLSSHAKVQDIDPGDIVDRLARRYPGIPRHVHQNYFDNTVAAANLLQDGTVVRCIITPDTCDIQVAGACRVIRLWSVQPLDRSIT